MAKSPGDNNKFVSSGSLVMVTIPGAVPSSALRMAYKELFAVVFKIPSESVKTRVLHAVVNALNGDSPMRSCKCSVKVEKSDRSTQTATGETESQEKSSDNQKSQIHPVGAVVKLGRKRKVLAPQATTGTDLGDSLPERLKSRRSSEVKVKSPKATLEPVQELSRKIEADIDNYNYSDIEGMISELENVKTTSDRDVKIMMLRDWVECYKYTDGYLPIHYAVKASDKIYLKRQCITLKFRGFGVDLKADDGSTALHLALKFNANIQIVEMLLQYGADVSEIDNDGNNSVLLAARYSQDINVFALLLRKTSFSELQRENFHSHGIFRIVVDSGRFDFLNELIAYIDECLKLPSLIPENLKNEKDIAKKYRERVDELTDVDMVKQIKINEKKAKMINQRDKTAGKTPLFCAVEKKKDNIVLALLANLADPRRKTFAGFDAYMVANEVVKSKKISSALISALNAFEIIDAMDEGILSNGSKTSRKLEDADEEPVTARKKRKV
ncbi:uncharacterized protein LOC129804868 [Phlebotomus papatasi]|uniref:uncharacterized protein LOC129804868 n=1 Tax=Phlebotomus papatasi TaxID=29031 RepID=UPI002483665C|nr:uncharacterized protein LOC129804868 [Phlebotomus papatasi]